MERRLAAVMMADVVGYSRLVEADEAGTFALLKERRKSVLGPTLRAHSGRIVKLMGDGVLIEFSSAVNAVAGAMDLLQKMAEANADLPDNRRIILRIGINLGDVIGEGSDIYGEGVNIAARLETLAEPGTICISAKVLDEVRGKLPFAFEDLGHQTLKNIGRPIRAYRVGSPSAGGLPTHTRPELSLPDRPSIAVLPFQNMSGEAEQEYFADGIVEEIITALSRIRWLFVIARNSSFIYKGRAVDVKQVGRELGVRYVLEGSVRKAGNRVRITGQLIDTTSGVHLWADRFDGELADVFDLQDQVTASVVGSIDPKLEQAEVARATSKPTDRLDAYDHYLRGLAGIHQWTREGNLEALSQLKKAIELDANFASAHGLAARCYSQRVGFAWVVDRDKEIADAAWLARRAAELGREDAVALCMAGNALIIVVGDIGDGAAMTDRALALNPNLAFAWLSSAFARVLLGEPELAIDHASRAMRLSPQDPQMFAIDIAVAAAHLFAGRADQALVWAQRAVQERSNFFVGLCVVAASAALTGRLAEAEKAILGLRRLNSALRISKLSDMQPFRRPEHLARLAEGLRLAGLSE